MGRSSFFASTKNAPSANNFAVLTPVEDGNGSPTEIREISRTRGIRKP
jgi:hypothetical protein